MFEITETSNAGLLGRQEFWSDVSMPTSAMTRRKGSLIDAKARRYRVIGTLVSRGGAYIHRFFPSVLRNQ
jgi:hypothetical protein